MNIETLIDTFMENGNKEVLTAIEAVLEEQSWKASCGAEVEDLNRLIKRMYPSKLKTLAIEMGLLVSVDGKPYCHIVTKDGYEAYYEPEDAISEEFIGFTNLETNKDNMFGEEHAEDMRAVYPQFFEADEVEAE